MHINRPAALMKTIRWKLEFSNNGEVKREEKKIRGSQGFAFDAGKAPVKTGLYMGTWCQTKKESACLTCGLFDSIHLLLARYRAISARQLNHVLRSSRHFLIRVS